MLWMNNREGQLTLDKSGIMYRTQGIVRTIEDGIVLENRRLMERVAEMVADSKKDRQKEDL